MTVLVWMTTIADDYMSGHYTFLWLFACGWPGRADQLACWQLAQADMCAYIYMKVCGLHFSITQHSRNLWVKLPSHHSPHFNITQHYISKFDGWHNHKRGAITIFLSYITRYNIYIYIFYHAKYDVLDKDRLIYMI